MSYALIQQRHYSYTYVTLKGKPHITEPRQTGHYYVVTPSPQRHKQTKSQSHKVCSHQSQVYTIALPLMS